MYRQSYQRGMLTIFFSVGSSPLKIWDTRTQDGYITRFLDDDIKSMVLEIGGTNVSTTYMTCPKGNMVLGITMPFLVMIVKNLRKYFSFEVTVLDETGTRRRFRVSNFQSTTQVLPLCTVMPIGLSDGWNQIQFNLAEFTRRAYRKQFIEVQKLKINANIRLRRVYFAERIIPEDQLPAEYKLFFPLKPKVKDKNTIAGAPETESVKEVTGKEVRTKKSTSLPISYSTRSIKRPSHEPGARPSRVLPVKEDRLDRVNALTEVIEAHLEPTQENTDLIPEIIGNIETDEDTKVESVVAVEGDQTIEVERDAVGDQTTESERDVEGNSNIEDQVVAGYEEDEEDRIDEPVVQATQAEEASVIDDE